MKEIYEYIDQHHQEAIEDLIRLCRQPSVSAQKLGIQESAQLVADLMRKYGVDPRILPTPGGGPPVVFGEVRGESETCLLCYNHYDVQPPEPLELWTTPPFEPTRYDDSLRARGVADNKGNILARLLAVKSFHQVRGRLPVSVKFCVEGEEEVGSPSLAAFVEENRALLRADACLWEGGEVDWSGRLVISLGLKGILFLELEARGAKRDAHSSLAAIAPNPAWRLVWSLASLKDAQERVLIDGFYDDVRPLTGQEMQALEAIPPEDDQLKEGLGLEGFLLGLTGLEMKRRHLFEPTINIAGLVSGYTGKGSKTVLPSLARAKVDIRLVPDQRPADILEKLRRHLDRHGFGDIALRIKGEGESPARTPLDSPFVKLVQGAAREVYGSEPILIPNMAGSGPMYPFAHVLGLPTASAGVENADSRPHAPDENIRIADFIAGAKHVAAILERLASEPAR